jgi:NodT family efflux transporter outer membrane factor (OMF) lipoprotein
LRNLIILSVIAGICVLYGCAVGPRVHPPQPQNALPQKWTAQATRGTSPGVEPQTDLWWKSFQDPELDSLIQRAVQANYDLRLATARVEEARAARGIARSDFYPQINATVSADRNRVFTVIPNFNNGGKTVQPLSIETNNYRGEFDAAWEIDVFGRIRREVQAASYDLAAQEQDRRNVLITLLGDVGRFYVDLRGFQLRLTIAEENIAVDEDAVTLTRVQAQAGQTTEREVAQAQAQLESVKAQVPALNSSVALSIHRLSVLTGQQPGALEAELANRSAIPAVPPDVSVGLPSDLLERRPDIQQAEAQLEAATARVGQAKADYFPRFTLLGSAGRQANQLHELTLGLGNFFTAGPSISLPVFTGGRIRSNVAVQNARVKEAFDVFQSSVLGSLEETENALVTYANEQERYDRLQATVHANQTALELANVQYKAGLADFLIVLDSERDLYTNQDLLAQSQAAISTDLVTLYKALGGGWSISPQATKTP